MSSRREIRPRDSSARSVTIASTVVRPVPSSTIDSVGGGSFVSQFCHGFAAGAYQYYQAIAAASPEQRYVCPPATPPSR